MITRGSRGETPDAVVGVVGVLALPLPPEMLSVGAKYDIWKCCLRSEEHNKCRYQMYDGHGYCCLGLLNRYIYHEVFCIGACVWHGLGISEDWVDSKGCMFQPCPDIISDMLLDRIVTSREWLTSLQYFRPPNVRMQFGLSRVELLQYMDDDGASFESIADFLDEVGWGSAKDVEREVLTSEAYTPVYNWLRVMGAI